MVLVAVTAVLFPFQYLSLEIPKQIINRAIGAETPTIDVLGIEMSQLGFLALLCTGLLATVIVQGLLKMRLNTMKGVLAERMLRRFRYGLITRLFRFPQRYYRRTSQGELVSMVTAESEGLGGMMGDAISLPLFQGGQMLTIIAFLMIQSPWLGLAACALIPLQAWLIPRMQRQINLLARQRVQEVRKFATVIGESADGAIHLRRSGGLRYWKGVISHRLGKLFAIRFEIYQKKFFMKFVNNFITQLTPLMFFSFGGFLVIQGDLTVGALVAALAAHKDLAAPWKELLTYYNQVQETAVRYHAITERFAPDGMIDEALIDAAPEADLSLAGDLELRNVTVLGEDGAARLKDVNLHIPAAAVIGVAVDAEETRHAIADLLTREALPAAGDIRVAGADLASLPQAAIAARIGHAGSRVFVHQGTFSQNTLLPLMTEPGKPAAQDDAVREALRSGNSPDPVDADWVHPEAARQPDVEGLRGRWLDLVEALDPGGALLAVALAQKYDPDTDPDLARRLLALRADIAREIAEQDLPGGLHRFDPDSYCDALPVADNLFYAVPTQPMTREILLDRLKFPQLLHKLDFEQEMLVLVRDVIELLQRIFGVDGVRHPLFRRIGLDPEVYRRCLALAPRLTTEVPNRLSDIEIADLMLIPFSISADRIGDPFTDEIKARIVSLRPRAGALLENGSTELFSPLAPDAFTAGLSLFENLVFGKLAEGSGPKAGQIQGLVAEALQRSGLAREAYGRLRDLPTEIGGANLSAVLAEALDVTRAAIKAPDILVLDHAMPSLRPASRTAAFQRLRALLPETTFVRLEPQIDDPSAFDACYAIRHTELVGAGPAQEAAEDRANPASVDLTRKIEMLGSCDLFADLEAAQLRLLAFGARWYSAPAGTLIFAMGDEPTDGAYLLADGTAELFVPNSDGTEEVFRTMEPGALIGELALIGRSRRTLSMRAATDVRALRIGSEELLMVIENDIGTAVKLLQVLTRYAAPRPR